MADHFDVEFEDYIVFHRGIRNMYITDENDENPLHLHVVYQDGRDIDMGNPYGNYVSEAQTASTAASDSSEKAKKWAIGKKMNGSNVASSDETYHNNAKYYAEQAAAMAAQAEEYLYGTLNGNTISGKTDDNVVHYYQETVSAASQFDGLGTRVHFSGVCETNSDVSNKIVSLVDEDGNTVSYFELKNGTHLFVDFTYDNTASDVSLVVGSYTLPVVFSGEVANFDKLCGVCEFAVKKVNNGFACTFIHSNKYEPIIYAVGSPPIVGKLGQLCVLKKESD